MYVRVGPQHILETVRVYKLLRYRHEITAHQVMKLGVQVICGSRIVSGDYWSTVAGRIKEWITPTFASMKRHVTIPTPGESSHKVIGPQI